MRQDTWPCIWQLDTRSQGQSLKDIFSEHFVMQPKPKTNAIIWTHLSQTQSSFRKMSNFLSSCFLLVYNVCSYFLTVWNGMNEGKLQRLTPTGLKKKKKKRLEIKEQIHSTCTEFVFSFHVTAFIHSKQMRNSTSLHPWNNAVFMH